jgi:hypothetical protein
MSRRYNLYNFTGDLPYSMIRFGTAYLWLPFVLVQVRTVLRKDHLLRPNVLQVLSCRIQTSR